MRVLVAVGVAAWLIHSTQRTRTVDVSSNLRRSVQSYLADGQRVVESYTASVEQQFGVALKSLFDELDANSDGCIRKEEFRGVGLGFLAATRAMRVPTLPTLPTFAEAMRVERSYTELFMSVIAIQLLFLIFLHCAEHLRGVIFEHRTAFLLENYKDKTPPHAPKSVALRYDTPATTYEKAKFFFFLFSGLLVLRIVLTAIFFALSILIINLAVLNGRTRDKNPHWFGVCRFLANLTGSFMLGAMGFYKIHTTGFPASRAECKTLIGNHVCMVELVAMYLNASFPSFVTRVENLSVPLFAGVCKVSDAIIVDRNAAESRSGTLAEIHKRSKNPNGPQLMVFPEGTCGNQLALFQFKKGAFEPGEPVQMVCTRFSYKHFNIAWTGQPGGGNDLQALLLRMYSQFVNHAEVIYLPVYYPTLEEKMNPIFYASHCQRMMANVLQIPTSDASYIDYQEAAAVYYKKHKVAINYQVSPALSRHGTPPPESDKKTA